MATPVSSQEVSIANIVVVLGILGFLNTFDIFLHLVYGEDVLSQNE